MFMSIPRLLKQGVLVVLGRIDSKQGREEEEDRSHPLTQLS